MYKSVVVIGAGISGLCVAHWLKKHGLSVTVLEKDSEAGGTMKTIHDNGWLVETGPNSALETTPLFSQLFDELGISNQRIYANALADKRYILRDKNLHPLPMGPGTFLTSKLWSVRGKLRLLKEPFIGRATKEESIAEFVVRRLGQEFLDYAINPFVAGVYAGIPEQLSVQAAFPKLYALEEKYGGLMKGMIQGRRERKQRVEKSKDRAKLFSFIDGMGTLPKAAASSLGTVIRLNCSVERIVPVRAGASPMYHVSYLKNGTRTTIESRVVVISTPAPVASKIVHDIDPEMSRLLESIYYPPVTVVFTGFEQSHIPRILDGFGFLVPTVEQRQILGTLWSSSLFPDRAPKNCEALTTFVGGARQPDLAQKNDDEIKQIVLTELQSLMGIHRHAIFIRIIRWERAIPQYNVGYRKILNAIDMFEQNFQGAFICSNYRGGISVGDCLTSAHKIATQVTQYLNKV